tara:strand:+ start:42830 stop:43570 length:741 start_codon:yes stop_codon:yes gene_type:complete
MSDMGQKPSVGTAIPRQTMLVDELIESSTNFCHWPYDMHDRKAYNVAAGHVVLRQGAKPDCFFEITSGTLKLSQVTEDGRQIILGFATSGDFVGLTGGKEYRYAAETLTMTRLHPINCKVFYEQMLQNRSARETFLGWLDTQEKMVQDHIATLSLQSPLAKLAAFLLKQISQQTKSVGFDDAIIDLPMTQRDIATYLAIAPETCSRAMKKLRQGKIIEATGRSGEGKLLKILDFDQLNEVANGPFI